MVEAAATVSDQELLIPTHYPRLTRNGLVIHADRRFSAGGGELSSGQVVVSTIRDRRFVTVEFFEFDPETRETTILTTREVLARTGEETKVEYDLEEAE